VLPALLASAALLAFTPDVAAARSYAAQRPGTVAFAVRTEDHFWGVRADRAFPSASVLKAMLLVAYLRRPDVRDRPLHKADRDLLTPMIRWSDNVAATRVRDIVTSAGLRRLGRIAHLPSLRVAAIWGLSRLDARDAARFFLELPDLVPRRHRAYATWLLAHVVASQRWGVGQIALPAGWRLLFKGGWGSGTGAVDHQAALLISPCGARLAVAVMTTDDGTHAYGQASLRGVFARLLRGLPQQRGA
jgi:beta-lactamase class A